MYVHPEILLTGYDCFQSLDEFSNEFEIDYMGFKPSKITLIFSVHDISGHIGCFKMELGRFLKQLIKKTLHISQYYKLLQLGNTNVYMKNLKEDSNISMSLNRTWTISAFV